jgi:hypothetical protein
MLISCIPPAEKTFMKHFWLAMALIASIWALLGIGTAIT